MASPQEEIHTSPPTPAYEPPGFEWTLPRVAGLAVAASLALVLIWVFWPAPFAPEHLTGGPTPPEPIALKGPAPLPAPVAAPPRPEPAAPSKPSLKLDAKAHVIDPFGAHLPDIPLAPSHKYRLRVERDDSRLGTALARLQEQTGWGVMRKMASHAALQFGGAEALRLHCTPGSRFADGATIPLELTDLATHERTAVPVNPALHCWDFEVTRRLDLGEGVKFRVRVPTDSRVALGEQVPLRVAYILESLGEKKEWRTGVLAPGESVLAEGRAARFALLDPYSGDNDGSLELELLPGDTENSGLVTPSATGAQFVPSK